MDASKLWRPRQYGVIPLRMKLERRIRCVSICSSEILTPVSYLAVSSTAFTRSPVRVRVAPIRLITVSRFQSGCPFHVRLINEKSRCSMRFHITRTRRIMRHGDGNPDPLRQLQQVCFPGPGATAIAATAIGANQQTSGRTRALSPIQPPPPPDTLHREFRRVVADPYVDHGPT